MTGPCPGRVVVTLSPQIGSTQWEAGPEKGQELDLSVESPCELREPEPSPFSSRRTMYETEEVRPGGHVVAVGRGKGYLGPRGMWPSSSETFISFIISFKGESRATRPMGPRSEGAGEGQPWGQIRALPHQSHHGTERLGLGTLSSEGNEG